MFLCRSVSLSYLTWHLREVWKRFSKPSLKSSSSSERETMGLAFIWSETFPSLTLKPGMNAKFSIRPRKPLLTSLIATTLRWIRIRVLISGKRSCLCVRVWSNMLLTSKRQNKIHSLSAVAVAWLRAVSGVCVCIGILTSKSFSSLFGTSWNFTF